MSTFVSVGNATQPFRRLLDAVCSIAAHLPQPVVIQYGAASDYSCPNCSCIAYMGMEAFEQHVAEAKLLILHAGAGSVIHAIRSEKVPVIMPRRADFGEHINNHQVEFCNQLEKTGKVLITNDENRLLDTCNTSLSIQQSTQTKEKHTPQLINLVKAIIEGSK